MHDLHWEAIWDSTLMCEFNVETNVNHNKARMKGPDRDPKIGPLRKYKDTPLERTSEWEMTIKEVYIVTVVEILVFEKAARKHVRFTEGQMLEVPTEKEETAIALLFPPGKETENKLRKVTKYSYALYHAS